MSAPTVKRQCKACPWRKGVVPARDIPNGYSRAKHCALRSTIATPGEIRGTLHMMTCHESPTGAERPCVGWAVNQLGVGNNLTLRMQAMRDERFQRMETIGPQHQRFEDTIP